MSTTPGTVDRDQRPTGRIEVTQRKQSQAGTPGVLARLVRRQRHRLLFAAPAVVYLAVRLIGLLVLSWLSAANEESLLDNLRAWDGQWYLEIAENGYSGVDPSMVDGFGNRYPETPLAFFPGYPVLVRWVSWLPGVSFTGAAIAVSLVAGVVAAHGLVRLGTRIGGSRAIGLLLVVLFAAAPMSVVLSMAYSEALFCALSIWALVGVLERRWALAGLCCLGAGLVRPTAAALIAVVGLAALIALFRRTDGWRPLVAVLTAPLGMLLYMGWVAQQTGELNGYFELQRRGWSSSFDGGAATLRFAVETLTGNKSGLETLTVWLSLVALVLLVMCVRQRLPWPLVAFAAAVLVLTLGSDGLMYSKVRLMLPAFPLLLPAAMGLARCRRATAVAVTSFVVFFGAWFGAYSLTTWPYAM